MEHLNSDNRWKLEFSVRGDDSQVNLVANATGEQQQLAFDQIDTYYQKKN